MGAQFVISKPLGPNAGRFYLIGDSSSVSVAQVALTANCNATSLDEPFTALMYPIPDATNITHYPEAIDIIQFYRASSFALSLSGFNSSVLPEGTVFADAALPNSVDRVFLQCINSTIGSTIPIMDAPDQHMTARTRVQTIALSSVMGVLLIGLALTFWRQNFCLRYMRRLDRWIKANVAGYAHYRSYRPANLTPVAEVEASRLQWWLSRMRLSLVIVLLVVLIAICGLNVLVSFVYEKLLSGVEAAYRSGSTQWSQSSPRASSRARKTDPE